MSLLVLFVLFIFILEIKAMITLGNPEPQRISSDTNITVPSSENSDNNQNSTKNSTKIENSYDSSTSPETEISSFSTKILVDDENRDNNLEITASKINGTVVKNGKEFSFNKVVGNPTEEKGYEKAGAFEIGRAHV